MLRLTAEITNHQQRDIPSRVHLVDATIPCYRKKGEADQWYLTTDELLTPLGLSLRIYAHRGTSSPSIVVKSVETVLLRSWSDSHVELLLPTEEVLRVSIGECAELGLD